VTSGDFRCGPLSLSFPSPSGRGPPPFPTRMIVLPCGQRLLFSFTDLGQPNIPDPFRSDKPTLPRGAGGFRFTPFCLLLKIPAPPFFNRRSEGESWSFFFEWLMVHSVLFESYAASSRLFSCVSAGGPFFPTRPRRQASLIFVFFLPFLITAMLRRLLFFLPKKISTQPPFHPDGASFFPSTAVFSFLSVLTTATSSFLFERLSGGWFPALPGT